MNVIYIDIETNGYRGIDILSNYNRIIQLGAIIGGQEFETYVDPGVPISHLSTKFHGIHNGHVADAPRFNEVWSHFLSLLDPRVTRYYLVAHSGKFNDKIMIIKELHRFGMEFDSSRFQFVDTDPILRHYLPEAPSHNLGALVRKYNPGYDFSGEHTALADCKALKALMERLEIPLVPCKRDDFQMIYELGHHAWLLKEYANVQTVSQLASQIPSFLVYRWIKKNMPTISEEKVLMALIRIYDVEPNAFKSFIF